MVRERGPFKLDNPWSRIAWWSIAGVGTVFFLLGFLVLGRYQLDGPTFGSWAAMCRALGISADRGPAAEPEPLLQTPTRIAWTQETLAHIASGNVQQGASVALNCTVCHGEQGVSSATLIPVLAGMSSAVIYKQLDDFRSHKRFSGVMSAIAAGLSDRDSADAAAYFARLPGGLPLIDGQGAPRSGHSLRQHDPGIRLVFVGEPARGIPPCAACHGPSGEKLAAPALQGQHSAYIESQLTAFAQGQRKNDINEQMRVIARELTLAEVRAVAAYYGGASLR